MNTVLRSFTVVVGAVGLGFVSPRQPTVASPVASAIVAPCEADSSFARLAFWIGDWEVLDSTGAHYATQRVRAAVDGCAITVEWTGRVGDKGLSLFAYDQRAKEWRQVYVSNQVPSPTGVILRRSDPSYTGAGVRFIALTDPPASELRRSRVTIMPAGDRRVLQLFENSADGGVTWRTLFKAEHRPLAEARSGDGATR